mmetsp:Transcript_16228/g.50380  ORF Transcript_16228/g.50380 Transcript_16228/m.50380 type:complete len:272 (+) Transcript_16228:1380-2195(+)
MVRLTTCTMSILVSNFSRLPCRRLNTFSAKVCGSRSSSSAEMPTALSASPLSTRSAREAERTARSSFFCFLRRDEAVPVWNALYSSFFDSLLAPLPLMPPVPGAPPAPSSSSSSSESSPSPPMPTPIKKFSAATDTRGDLWCAAVAMTFTLRSSVHTLRRYSSMSTASARLTAASLASCTAANRKACSWRLTASWRWRLLMARMSATTCRKSMVRSVLSDTRKSRKKSGSTSVASSRPFVRSSMSALTRPRRRSACIAIACRSTSAISSLG